MLATVERYFAALGAMDWPALAGCLAADVRRTGPYLDVVRGRDAYVAFLTEVVPRLRGYRLEVHELRALADGGAVARISESMERGGGRESHPELICFDFDAEGRIAAIDIYLKQPPGRRA